MFRNTLYLLLLALFIGTSNCISLSDSDGETSAEMSTQESPVQRSIHGSWEVESIHQITPDTTYHLDPSQPGLFIVAENRYSIMWTPTPQTRTPFEKLSDPSPEEVQAAFGSVVFNAGSYILTDSTITTKPYIAKAPGFEGGSQVYRYELTGNDLLHLTMIDEVYPDGTKPSWYGKTEIMFVLKRSK